MTDTVYTNRFEPYNSSVIRTVFYNSANKELYILLRRDDVLCGYANVPGSVYRSLVITDGNGQSVGSYWNTWIKPNFEGIPTDDVHLISQEDFDALTKLEAAPSGAEKPVLVDITQAEEYVVDHTVSEATDDEAPEVDAEPFEFAVVYSFDDVEDEILYLFAFSVADALDKFNTIGELAGWEGVTITSVTQFL